MKAIIVLEDGSRFEGVSIGSPGEKAGEVVLNTAVVGYQEMMTDPANAGKILVLTYPLIGNYGVAKKFNESKKCWISGLVIKESSRICSNWQAEGTFNDFLKTEGVLTMADADTRTIATTIRDKGEMLGIISTTDFKKDSLLKKLSAYKNGLKKEHIKEVSVKKPSEAKSTSAGPDIAVLDLGMLHSFTTQLKNLGCSVTLLPYHTSAEAILDMTPDGLIISGGPEDDAAIASVAKTVKALLGKVPMMGIGTGHQAIGLALGARLTRMKVGHHGVNYPVKDGANLKGDITVQNHSYTIDEASIKDRRINVTLRNINDNTVEEIESKQLKLLSVQYYPASPGFNEVNGAFKRFISMAGHRRGASAQKAARASQSEVTYAKA